jgi:hypothetical protein
MPCSLAQARTSALSRLQLWSGCPDSNRGPPAPKALPSVASPARNARSKDLERLCVRRRPREYPGHCHAVSHSASLRLGRHPRGLAEHRCFPAGRTLLRPGAWRRHSTSTATARPHTSALRRVGRTLCVLVAARQAAEPGMVLVVLPYTQLPRQFCCDALGSKPKLTAAISSVGISETTTRK